MNKVLGVLPLLFLLGGCQFEKPTEYQGSMFQIFSLRITPDQSIDRSRLDSTLFVSARLIAGTDYAEFEDSHFSDGQTDFSGVPSGVPYTVSVVGKGRFGDLLWFGSEAGVTLDHATGPAVTVPYTVVVGVPAVDTAIAGVWVKLDASLSSDTLVFGSDKYRTPYASGVAPFLNASKGKVHCGSTMDLCGEYRIGRASAKDTLHFKGIRSGPNDSLIPDPTASIYFKLPTGVLSPKISSLSLAYDTLFLGGGATGINAVATSPKGGLRVSFNVYQGTKDFTGNFAIAYPEPEAASNSWDASAKGRLGIYPRSSAVEGRYELVLTVDNDFGRTTRAVPISVKAADFGKDQATSVYANGVIFNGTSPFTGAFDLIGKVAVDRTADSSAKDLVDATEVGGVFDGTIKSGNGSDFVKVGSGFSFDRATIQSIAAAFTGTPVTRFTARAGDVWIARVKKLGPNIGVAIKITEVHVETGYAKDGFVKFTYRL